MHGFIEVIPGQDGFVEAVEIDSVKQVGFQKQLLGYLRQVDERVKVGKGKRKMVAFQVSERDGVCTIPFDLFITGIESDPLVFGDCPEKIF